MPDVVLLLAGGAARRFPGKLERKIEGTPLIVRVVERLRETGLPIVIAGNESFTPAVAAALQAPFIADHRPNAGPLAALLGAAPQLDAERIFAVAADMPQIDAEALEAMARAWQPGDEAVVLQHDGRSEPLAALYDRRALIAAAPVLESEGRRAMRDLVAMLATRFVALDAHYFVNVNYAHDLRAVERAS